MFRRYSRVLSAVVMFFFTWTSGGVFAVARAAVDGVKKGQSQAQQKTETAEERLSRLTEELSGTLADPKGTVVAKKERLKTAQAEMASLDAEIRKQFAETERRLKETRLPAEILERHYRFVKHYEDNLGEFAANVAALEMAKNDTEAGAALEKVRQHLERVKAPAHHKPLDPNNLPVSQRKAQKREPRMNKEDFERDLKKDKAARRGGSRIMVATVGSLAGLVAPDDLAETAEVQFSPEIKAKAQELGNSPLKIYEWVHNNIEFVPTWGSIQGARMTLLSKQGNAFDSASLLIALLRAAGVNARYVTGTIELPIDKVMNWAGGFSDPLAALDFMSSGGIPTKGLVSGGKIVAARMEHVWVEAFVDYLPSRGARHVQGNGDTWVKLDTSYKQYNFTQGIDLNGAVPLDSAALVEQIKSTATVNEGAGFVAGINSQLMQQSMQDYQARLLGHMQQNYPDATVGDLLGKKEIVRTQLPYLLGTLPYRTAVKGATFASIPDSLRQKLSFRVENEAADLSSFDPDAPDPVDTSLNLTKSLPELAGKKITLSYAPATPQDESVLNSFLPKPHADGSPILATEYPGTLRAYLVNVRPELRVDGQLVATGAPVGLGGTNIFTMTFSDPTYGASAITNYINAGSFNAVGLNVGRISGEELTTLQAKINATKNRAQDPLVTQIEKEAYIGDLLYATAIAYHSIIDVTKFAMSRYMGVNCLTLPSEDIFSYPLEVRTFFGLPFSVTHNSVNMDADSLVSVVKAKDGNSDNAKQYMLAVGMASSALENSVPERLFSTDTQPTEGVSAVKALKIANDQGIPIYTVNQGNVATVLPQLALGQDVKTDIQNSVNAGKVVTVSKSNISYKGWTGCGYIVTDPETGAGAYMISGGLSGFFAMLGAYFTAISDILCKDQVKGLVNVKDSPFWKVCDGICKFLTVLGYAVTVYDIVNNPKLSELQKVLEILVWLGAVVAMLQIGAWIGGIFTLLPAMLLAIVVYLAITMITLWIIEAIENNVAFLRSRRRLSLSKMRFCG